MTLLDNDRQIHPLVNLAKDVIGSRGSKRSDLNAATIDLYVVNSRCSWLISGFGDAILPGAIGQDVQRRDVIHQHELRAFGNGNRRLEKIASAHMHGGHAVGISRARGYRFLRDGPDEDG